MRLANWHPHLHLVVTDGGFRPDGTFVRWPRWPGHDTARLTEAFGRAVLRLFVRRGLFEKDQAAGMQWPHSGFQVHAGVGVPEDDRAFALRLARYCARNPVALERLTFDADGDQVTYRSDKTDGPTAGTVTVGPARVPGSGRRPHSQSGPGDAALLRLVRQPDPGGTTAAGSRRRRPRRRAGRLVAAGGPRAGKPSLQMARPSRAAG